MFYFFGVLDIKTDAGELRKSTSNVPRLMRHRGPDWSGVYASDKAIPGSRTSSIVDSTLAHSRCITRKTHALAR